MSGPQKANALLRGGRSANTELKGYRDHKTFYRVAQPFVPLGALHPEQILREIARLRVIQRPVESLFWNLEQRIGLLRDELDRRASS